MKFLRNHWYDLGWILAVAVLAYTFLAPHLTLYELVLWLSLVSLFFHQLEEYRIVGTFPGMINRIVFKSNIPDRYPLNMQTSFIINVLLGWSIYFLAAVFAENAVWLGIATILVSLGNVIAHTFVFNIKGKTFYNAGMATSWVLFVPCIYFFIKIVMKGHLATPTDYIIGLFLGILLNVFGIFKLIEWFADKDSPYIFEQRNLLKKDKNIDPA